MFDPGPHAELIAACVVRELLEENPPVSEDDYYTIEWQKYNVRITKTVRQWNNLVRYWFREEDESEPVIERKLHAP